jgi:hypothetical protein
MLFEYYFCFDRKKLIVWVLVYLSLIRYLSLNYTIIIDSKSNQNLDSIVFSLEIEKTSINEVYQLGM